MIKNTMVAALVVVAAVAGSVIGSGVTAYIIIKNMPTPATVMAAGPKAPPDPALVAAYDKLAQLPEWQGAWEADPLPSVLETDEEIPLTPKYAAKLAQLRADAKAGKLPGKDLDCRPEGMPMFMAHTGPLVEIVFGRDRVVMNSGSLESRIIYTDGRPLEDPDSDYFNGAAVGHWEHGDSANYLSVLVSETIGIVADANVFPGMTNDGGLNVKESIRLVSPNKLRDTITLTNPKMFTKPYTYTRTFTKRPEWEVSDYVCLRDAGVDYGVGKKPTKEEFEASTDVKPPVRQEGKPAENTANLPGGTWDTMYELPDWGTGMWDYDNQPSEAQGEEVIPLTPVYAPKMDELRAIHRRGGDVPTNNYHCWPRGPAFIMKGAVANFYVVFTPGLVELISDYPGVRRIFTDGRPHPSKMELNFTGHSIGRWENDTLVVDTVGTRPDMQMFNGMPNGGKMHLVERLRKTSPTKMRIDTTIEDPVALTKPWSYFRTYSYHGDWSPMENYCTQNNRDVDPGTGLQQFNKTPPPETP